MKKISLLVLISLFTAGVFAAANFYSDGTIGAGTPNTSVYTWNNANVTMTNGTIVSLDEFNSSRVDIQAGTISQGTSLWNQSQLSLNGGKLDLFLETHDSAAVSLKGGQLNGWLYAADTSVINVYGYGFHYDSLAGTKNGGLLTGFWSNGQSFYLNLLDNHETNTISYQHIILHQIPEPATLLLLTFGGILAVQKK